MGKKRRLISKRQKFGNKYAAHPLISNDTADIKEVELSEASSATVQEAVARAPEPVVPPPVLVEEKVEVAPVAKKAAPPKKRATRKRASSSRRARTSRKTKAKTEASA